ncbi:orotidine-5'-phosphate decarboxylase [Kineosporia succinea]|uniref:Orotidine 5'-phosphate decarboxylase n=1 Tax=Kineosporia succinea TaxID=84632 RepID=A0ABT9NV30_9ACTN|nr:orotidine-5'-phosphate decarboxylase [Kineosporia succinea]MDP9824288.1 orotidine-5'-phosphate decarboxylase [Kineosporia succinea]
MTFGSRLSAAIGEHGPLCVGIDPHPGLLAKWGLDDDVAGLETFTMTVVEALAGRVAAIKPQAAFFERHGSKGVAVLERALEGIREEGGLSVVDAKRGDIGSTMSAYADAFVGESSPLAGDAVTVSPFLGFGSLRPLLDLAAANGRGVFVLALTSNPEGGEVQHAVPSVSSVSSGPKTVAQNIIDAVAAENAGAGPLGSVGVVVGATVTGAGREHDLSALNGPILAPGIGAQGATADDLREVFGPALRHVLPNSSREVLGAGPTVAGLREAADRTVEAVSLALRA